MRACELVLRVAISLLKSLKCRHWSVVVRTTTTTTTTKKKKEKKKKRKKEEEEEEALCCTVFEWGTKFKSLEFKAACLSVMFFAVKSRNFVGLICVLLAGRGFKNC